MAYRRLNEQEWALIWACFPGQVMGRPRKWSDRDCLDAILYLLHSGGRWGELGPEFPPKSTVHDRFSLWARSGVLSKVFKRLRRKLPLGQVFHLDSTVKSAKKGETRRTRGESEGQQNKPRGRRSRFAC
jgi:transposase